MSYRNNHQSMILPLGISAIDVLCCAMVASFVLFLVLSSQPTRTKRGIAKGQSTRSMQLRLTVPDSSIVVGLRMLPPQSQPEMEPMQVALWTDEAANASSPNASSEKRPAIQKGGGWRWIVFPRGGESLLMIERPINGQWGADLSYSHGPSLEDVVVNVQLSGTCAFESDVTLKPGETIHIADLEPNQPCSGQKSLSLSF